MSIWKDFEGLDNIKNSYKKEVGRNLIKKKYKCK